MTGYGQMPEATHVDSREVEMDTIQHGDWLIEHAHAPMAITGTQETVELEPANRVFVRHRLCQNAQCWPDTDTGEIRCEACGKETATMYYDQQKKALVIFGLSDPARGRRRFR